MSKKMAAVTDTLKLTVRPAHTGTKNHANHPNVGCAESATSASCIGPARAVNRTTENNANNATTRTLQRVSISSLPKVEFRVVSQNRTAQRSGGLFRKAFAASLVPLYETLQGWYHYSLPRLVLIELRSAYHRILSSRCRRMALNYAEVRRSLPLVPCSDSRNEMQFCSDCIRKLSAERPYLTLADCRLFVEGFFLSERWYAHLGTLRRNEQYDSCLHPPEAQQVYAAPSSSATDQG